VELIANGVLVSDTPKGAVRLGFPSTVIERWFPGLYQPPRAPYGPACLGNPSHRRRIGLHEARKEFRHDLPFDRSSAEIARRARQDDLARRLMTIPGVGPVVATAVEALAPPMEVFRVGRDFAAWLGLTPLQHSTGGKQRLGKMSKMGERTLRRLLIIGASSVVRQAVSRGAPAGSWLTRMLAKKPRMLVIVALANKMARIVWALMVRGGFYRAPAATM